MGILNRIKDQLDFRDGGKTWSNPKGQSITQRVKPNFTPAPMKPFNFNPALGPHLGGKVFLQPQDNIAAGNDVRMEAQKNLQFTPAFTQNVVNGNPYIGKPFKTSGLTDPGAAAAEYLGSYRPDQIVLGQKYSSPQKVGNQQILLHEGLHRVWDTNPRVRKQFTQAYDATAPSNPGLRQYLQRRVAPYADAQSLMDEGGVYKNDFTKLESLPDHLQNEIHSYIPQGYYSPKELGPSLTNYYRQYYNPEAASDYATATGTMFGLLNGYDTGSAQRDPRTSIFQLMNKQRMSRLRGK